MRSSGGRSAFASRASGAVILAAVAVTACTPSTPDPVRTQEVAARTDAPTPSAGGPTLPPFSSTPPLGPVDGPSFPPAPAGEPVAASEIVAGAVNRSSLDMVATYRVYASLTVGTGAVDVSTRIEARNDSGAAIDRLELNTIAARLGRIKVTEAAVDDVPVKVAVRDQTLVVPLGGILPDGATATVRIAYRATLRRGLTGSDWMFSRADGTIALYRWIPWISRAVPFDRPNDGEPFVTTTSPLVSVELLTDEPMILAAPAARIDEYAAGRGSAWSFTVRDVRDVSMLLAPDFKVTTGESNGVPIRAFTRPRGLPGRQLVDLAAESIKNEADLLGVAYPWSVLTVVETPGGFGLPSPGLIWIPRNADSRNRTYGVAKGTAHQWFYGLVGSNQQSEPFADEAPADLLARTTLGTRRASRCGREALDDAITAYSRTCYYEVVRVQGGLLLDDLRHRMGANRFWDALGTYLEERRFGAGGTKALLETLRAASDADLLPILRVRFPDLY